MPCPGMRELFGLCNFACANPHDGDAKKKEFCTGVAWHSFSVSRVDHQFKCDDIHKNVGFRNLEICILIDCTGSMQRFIEESRKAVADIVKFTKEKYPKLEIKFAVVGYRDHPMHISQIFQKQKKAASVKLDELLKMGTPPKFAEKHLTEAEYVKLLIMLEQKYEQKKSKGEDYKAGWNDL